jgi:hypothetical protein
MYNENRKIYLRLTYLLALVILIDNFITKKIKILIFFKLYIKKGRYFFNKIGFHFRLFLLLFNAYKSEVTICLRINN